MDTRTRHNVALYVQFSRLPAAEVWAPAIVMLDTPCSEVVWSVPATHSIRQFPLHYPSRASPCVITFQLDSNVHGDAIQLGKNMVSDGSTPASHSAWDTESVGSFETSLLPTKIHHTTSKNTVTSFTIRSKHCLLSRDESDIRHWSVNSERYRPRSSEGEQPWHRVTAITGYHAIQTVTQRVGRASYFCVTNKHTLHSRTLS